MPGDAPTPGGTATGEDGRGEVNGERPKLLLALITALNRALGIAGFLSLRANRSRRTVGRTPVGAARPVPSTSVYQQFKEEEF